MKNSKKGFRDFCATQIDPLILNDDEQILYDGFGMYLDGLNGALDTSKGLFLQGMVGSGKTIMFKMAQRYPKAFILKMVNCAIVEENFEAGQDMERYSKGEWCFDDLGAEQKANDYGKAVEVFKRLIESRYDQWKYYGVRTHFTTNCSGDDLVERYGERAYDRLKEMCNVELSPSQESKRGESIVKINTSRQVVHQMITREEKDRLNKIAIVNMITRAYQGYLDGHQWHKNFMHKDCYSYLEEKKLISFDNDFKNNAVDVVKNFKREKLKDEMKNVVQEMKHYNPIDDAKTLCIWSEFKIWHEMENYSAGDVREIINR